MALFNEQRQLRGFLQAIGCAHLADDPRFASGEARRQNARALVGILDEVFAQRDLSEWRGILHAAGVTFGDVGLIDETPGDAQLQQAGALVAFADGNGLTVSSPFHVHGEAKVAPRRAPSVGQHTEEVLHELGYSGADIARLRALAVVT